MDIGIKQVSLLTTLFLGVVIMLSLITIQIKVFETQNRVREIVNIVELENGVTHVVREETNKEGYRYEEVGIFRYELPAVHYEVCIKEYYRIMGVEFQSHFYVCMKTDYILE
jgi:hypothetical protein